jgi:hypothetical protein
MHICVVWMCLNTMTYFRTHIQIYFVNTPAVLYSNIKHNPRSRKECTISLEPGSGSYYESPAHVRENNATRKDLVARYMNYQSMKLQTTLLLCVLEKSLALSANIQSERT